MRLEIQDELAPLRVWLAKILENVGGRLLLQYEGTSHAFWLFYLSHRLHPIGWASDMGLDYSPPSGTNKG